MTFLTGWAALTASGGRRWPMRQTGPMTVDALPPRGWYDDPADEARERYWDGRAWTQRVRRKATPTRRRVDEAQPTPAPGPTDPPGGLAAGARPAPPVAAGGQTVAGFPLATWSRRVGGSLIDAVIVSLLLVVVLSLARDFTDRLVAEWRAWADPWLSQAQSGSPLQQFQTQMAQLGTVPPALLRLTEALVVIRAGLVAIYSAAFLGAWGATPGMRLAGLRVVAAPPLERVAALPPQWVSAQDAAGRLGWSRALWRSLAWALLDAGFNFFALVQVFSLLMPLWHARRQTVHDLVARTVVIRQRV